MSQEKSHGKKIVDEKSQEKSHKEKVTGKKVTYIMSSFRSLNFFAKFISMH
jgi:hypothetical protein